MIDFVDAGEITYYSSNLEHARLCDNNRVKKLVYKMTSYTIDKQVQGVVVKDFLVCLWVPIYDLIFSLFRKFWEKSS